MILYGLKRNEKRTRDKYKEKKRKKTRERETIHEGDSEKIYSEIKKKSIVCVLAATPWNDNNPCEAHTK